MYVNFEIAALFPLPYSRVKKGGNFKTNIHLDSVVSFLYCLYSRLFNISTTVIVGGVVGNHFHGPMFRYLNHVIFHVQQLVLDGRVEAV